MRVQVVLVKGDEIRTFHTIKSAAKFISLSNDQFSAATIRTKMSQRVATVAGYSVSYSIGKQEVNRVSKTAKRAALKNAIVDMYGNAVETLEAIGSNQLVDVFCTDIEEDVELACGNFAYDHDVMELALKNASDSDKLSGRTKDGKPIFNQFYIAVFVMCASRYIDHLINLGIKFTANGLASVFIVNPELAKQTFIRTRLKGTETYLYTPYALKTA